MIKLLNYSENLMMELRYGKNIKKKKKESFRKVLINLKYDFVRGNLIKIFITEFEI